MALGSFILGGGINPYPIGSIYISTNDTSPAELFGGTWQQIKDVFLLASGDSYEAGSTGGEAEHNHLMRLRYSWYRGTVNGYASAAITIYNYDTGSFNEAYSIMSHFALGNSSLGDSYGEKKSEIREVNGSVSTSNNMPPYLSVYCWERIA